MEAPLLVHHARVAGSAATRNDVERWLERVPVESLGLGKDEMFYVPQLRLRVPDRGGIADARMPDRILAALRQLLAGAERGWARGFMPDRPYRFTSRGTYSAWLVKLWIADGSAAAKEAFRRATGKDRLVAWQRATLLCDGPALVATTARLAEIGIAARWIARFEPVDIALAERAIEASFGLPVAAASAANDPRPASRSRKRHLPAGVPKDFLAETIARLTVYGNEWHLLPAPARALLLAMTVLAQKPAILSGQSVSLAAVIAMAAARTEMFSPDDMVLALRPPAVGDAPGTPEHDASSPGFSKRHRPRPPSSPGEVAWLKRNDEINALPTRPDVSGHGASQSASTIQQPSEPLLFSVAEVRRATAPAALLAPDVRFSTAYGGLLFLLNAFLALGLYPDFTQPKGKRLEPSPLWLADRIGRLWFGASYRRDPLANWVAANAGSGRLPRSWRIEPDWLAGFETAATPRRTISRRRVTLWHPAGFPLFDGDERHSPRLRRACPASITPARLPRADRWSACLALYLNARLRHLTGTGLSLLAQPATVEVRDLDLGATFTLDRHPIELRLAGLDRNPGWQPAEGRTIAFAFE